MKRSYLKVFLSILFLSFVFLFPQASSALEIHRPDPLSDVHKRTFDDEIKFTGFGYVFNKDVLPEKHDKRRIRKPGKEFYLKLNGEVSNKVLKIEFAGESVYDHASIEDPVLNITSPDKDRVFVKLNKPEIYLSGLSQGEYRFLIDGVGMGYDYLFDVDLVDWFFAGKVAYISNSFDVEKNESKLDKYLDKNKDRLLISANESFNSNYGLEIEEREFTDQVNNSVVINLASIKDKIGFFSSDSEFSPIYSIDEGVLVSAKSVGDDKLIAISSDLTRLSVSDLRPVLSNISDYYLKHQHAKLIWKWFMVLLVIFILGFWIYRKNIDLKKDFKRYWLEFNSWREAKKRKILSVLIILVVVGFIFSLFYVFFGSLSIVKFLRNRLAEVDNKKRLFFGGMATLLSLGGLAYFEPIWGYFKKVINRYKKLIIYILLAVFTFEAYNLVFDLCPLVNSYLGYLLALLLVLYFASIKDGLSNNKLVLNRYYLNLVLVLIIALAPIYFVWISQPYWQNRPWIKENRMTVSGGKIASSYGFGLTNKKNRTKITESSISIKGRQDYKLSPKLAGKIPDKVEISIDSRGEQPIFLKAKSDGFNRDYLVDYPNFDDYTKIATEGGLAIWINKKVINKKVESVDNIEKFINSLPKNISLETTQDLIAGSSPLEQGKEDVIDLSSFYKRDINSINSLNSYQLDVELHDYSIYSYFKDSIDIRVKKHDLNKILGSDQANLALYGPGGNLIKAIKLDDDNRPIGKEGKINEYRIKLDKKVKEGVYNLRFYDFSGGDMVVDSISLNSPYLSFDKNFIPKSVDISDFYQHKNSIDFVSLDRGSYFYPFNRSILKPGSSAEILVYRDPDKISQNFVSYSGDFLFSLFAYDKSKFGLENIQVDYHYLD